MEVDEFRKFIDHKFVIFDTNIFIKAYEHFDAFKVLFDLVKSANCKVVYFPLIEFEFARGAFLPDHRQDREDMFKIIATEKMPIRDDLIYSALDIARIYSHNKLPSIHLVDCCIAAYMKQHHDKLFLVTLNHRDFPNFLFDRLHIQPIDSENEVFAPAFYQFNNDKWASLQEKLSKVS